MTMMMVMITNTLHHHYRYVNKNPKWNDNLRAFVLNFNRRVTKASVKNFQLIRLDRHSSTSSIIDDDKNSVHHQLNNDEVEEEEEVVYLQFGRINKDEFTMDYRYPLSALQVIGRVILYLITSIIIIRPSLYAYPALIIRYVANSDHNEDHVNTSVMLLPVIILIIMLHPCWLYPIELFTNINIIWIRVILLIVDRVTLTTVTLYNGHCVSAVFPNIII